MKKIAIISLTLALVAVAQAGVRSVEEASAIASAFSPRPTNRRQAPALSGTNTTLQPVLTQYKKASQEPAYYIFNREDEQGFVLVSGDDRTDDVLFYSERGSFDPDNVNPNMAFWLRRMQEELSMVTDENVIRRASSEEAVTPIAPLLGGISWYQSEPYNRLCPIDSNDNTRSYTGCVATAAAQIMRYWEWPIRPNGTETYTWICYKVNSDDSPWGGWGGSWWGGSQKRELFRKDLTVKYDEEEPYNWDLMLPRYKDVDYTEEQANEVARLMYHAGVAAHMEYGGDATGGSGALTDDMGNGMVEHFGYKYTTFLDRYSNPNIPISTFEEAFNEDLEAGRPILMGGYDNTYGGHEFVCEGRDASGKFYINWGWEDDNNGYTTLSILKPENLNEYYNNYIDAIIGLEPELIDTIHVESVIVDPAELTLYKREKAQLAVTILPDNASIKRYTFSSADPTIATVSKTGIVKALAPGETEIVATSKEGNKIGRCLVTVLDEDLPFTYCDPFAYTFTKEALPVIGTNRLDNYEWNINLSAGSITWDNSSSARGLQLGSRSLPASTVQLTTDDPAQCRVDSILVNASTALGGDVTLSVYIGDERIGETVTLTAQATDYVFYNTTDYRGRVEIIMNNSSQRAVYIKAINMAFHVPTGVDKIADKTSKNSKFIKDGQLFILRDGKVYNALGQIIH